MRNKLIVLFMLSLSVSACGSSSTELRALAEKEPVGNEIVCFEAKAATIFSMFSGETSYRKLGYPKEMELTKEELLDMAARCFTGAEYGFLLDAINARQ